MVPAVLLNPLGQAHGPTQLPVHIIAFKELFLVKSVVRIAVVLRPRRENGAVFADEFGVFPFSLKRFLPLVAYFLEAASEFTRFLQVVPNQRQGVQEVVSILKSPLQSV